MVIQNITADSLAVSRRFLVVIVNVVMRDDVAGCLLLFDMPSGHVVDVMGMVLGIRMRDEMSYDGMMHWYSPSGWLLLQQMLYPHSPRHSGTSQGCP